MFALTCVSAATGASVFIVNWQAQRLISGRPKEWFSAQQVHLRRQALAHLLAPALLAYVATVAAGFGTTALTQAWPGWGSLTETAGFWLIFGGGVALFAGVMMLIGRVHRTPWDLVKSHEALLFSAQRVDSPVTRETIKQWRQRLSEIEKEARGRKGQRAGALWTVEDSEISHVPKPLAGTLVGAAGDKMDGPTWGMVADWIRRRPTIVLTCAAASLAAAFWAVVLPIAIVEWAFGDVVFSALLLLIALLGLVLDVLGGRLDLIWYARTHAEDRFFRAQILEKIREHEDALSNERSQRELLESMRQELTQVHDAVKKFALEGNTLVGERADSAALARVLRRLVAPALAKFRAPGG